MTIFSDRLSWMRERRGFTKKEMAEHLGVSQPYYGKFEKGDGQPNIETLAKIPSKLKCTLDFLCGVTHFDDEGLSLGHQYLSSRLYRERSKKRIEDTVSAFESMPDADVEHKLKMILRSQQRLETHKRETEEHFQKMIDYISKIPHIDNSLLTFEQWDIEFEAFRKRNDRIDNDT